MFSFKIRVILVRDDGKEVFSHEGMPYRTIHEAYESISSEDLLEMYNKVDEIVLKATNHSLASHGNDYEISEE